MNDQLGSAPRRASLLYSPHLYATQRNDLQSKVAPMPDHPLTTCLFCGKTNLDGLRLVATANATAAICGPCVLRCTEILMTGRDELAEPVIVTTPEGEAMAHRMSGGAQ